MVERAGRAVLADLEDRRGFKHLLMQLKYDDPEIYAEIVQAVGRASITAIREPTEAMVKRAWAHTNPEDVAGVWREAIDEALR
jgi:hypothetical protein